MGRAGQGIQLSFLLARMLATSLSFPICAWIVLLPLSCLFFLSIALAPTRLSPCLVHVSPPQPFPKSLLLSPSLHGCRGHVRCVTAQGLGAAVVQWEQREREEAVAACSEALGVASSSQEEMLQAEHGVAVALRLSDSRGECDHCCS